MHGDTWSRKSYIKLPDGSPDPCAQVSIINSRLLTLLAGTRDRWPLAGDNLIGDFDLGSDHVSPGVEITIGDVVLQVSDQEHTGCQKFVSRYGVDAAKFVNSDVGRQHNLRGVYARVIERGIVRVGDTVKCV